MFYMIYVSSAVEELSDDQLVGLLEQSRKNNMAAGITGMLLYKDGNFMQVLEGEEATIRALYEKICRDKRHHGHIVLDEGDIDQRQFADWSMGFRNLKDASLTSIPGYNEFMNRSLTAEEFVPDSTGCLRLLRLFR